LTHTVEMVEFFSPPDSRVILAVG